MRIYLLLLAFLMNSSIAVSGGNDKKNDAVFDVFDKLLETLDPPQGYDWTPKLEVTPDTILYALSIPVYDKEKDKFGFKIKISRGILDKLTNNDDNALAYLLGHELAHIKLGHLTENLNYETSLVSKALTRHEEFEADNEAIKIAVDAGYSHKSLINSLRMIALDGYNTSGFDCLSKEHPSWSERLANLDTLNRHIWKSISTFKNGTTFLKLRQYEPAIHCFQYVADQFPDCYEAYANLGYARLMRYIQLLEPEDIRNFNIGYLVTGSYYHNPKSMHTVFRGIDAELWWQAVGAMKMALTLKEDQPLVKANLGMAYLISPVKNIDIGKSAQYFSETLEALENDKDLTQLQKATIYINAGTAFIKTNKSDSVVHPVMLEAEENFRQFADFYPVEEEYSIGEIGNAINFNQALLLSRRDDSLAKAVSLLGDFLKNTDPASPWWDEAYKRYAELSGRIDKRVETRDLLKSVSTDSYGTIVGLELENSEFILLSDQLNKITTKLDKFNSFETTVIPGKNLKKITFKELGLEILATNYVFAIFLNDKSSPEIVLFEPDITKKSMHLYVGMGINEFEALTRQDKYMENVALLDENESYRYYFNLGLALKVNSETDKVEEIVITQLAEW